MMCPDYVKREFFYQKKVKKKLDLSKKYEKKLLEMHLFWDINTPCIFERSTTPNINKGKDGYKL